LTDFVGAIVELYAFDAYGNAISFDPSVALTEFLYSGEQFDSKIGQQYLRARYYAPATGRFNRLDPFFGNLNDPQSLHKYLYTHADPVNGIDPNGYFATLVSLAIGALNSLALRISDAKTHIAVGGESIFVLRGLERMQQLITFLVQRGQTILAYEQRIVGSTGQMIGRFRIDVII
jgi:RHS repeat-associated protein